MSILCPACNKILKSPKALPAHVNKCKEWARVVGTPPSQFNFNKHFKRGVWADGTVEGVDFVSCPRCSEQGLEVRVKRLHDHLRMVHPEMSIETFKITYSKPLSASGPKAQRKKTTLKKYGVEFVSQDKEIKQRIRQTQTENPHNVIEGRKKAAKTNLTRYGSENPFGSKEIQDKIRQTNLAKYGAENPQQVKEIREKTEATTKARYGSKSFLLSEAWFQELAEKREVRKQTRRQRLMASGRYEICKFCNEVFTAVTSTHKAVCQGWARAPKPEPCLCGYMCFSGTTMKRHRVNCSAWKSRDVYTVTRSRVESTTMKRFGVRVATQSPFIMSKIFSTNMKRYGAKSVFSRNSTLYAKVQKSLEGKRYVMRGDQNPFSKPEVQSKIRSTLLEKYGVAFPHLLIRSTGPNKLEQEVQTLCPLLIFVGNHAFWKWLPAMKSYKNPDFLVPGPDPEHPRRGTTKVVEIFGDYWHSEKFTGKSNEEHERELVSAYAEIGISCLVLWERFVRPSPDHAKMLLDAFLTT